MQKYIFLYRINIKNIIENNMLKIEKPKSKL